MKRLFIIIISSIVFNGDIIAQTENKKIPDGIFYLVRHAEKDTGKNPVLSMAGNLRAGDLYRVLKKKKIDRVYFTQFRRTRLTGDSLRIYQKIDSIQYTADATGDDLVSKLNWRHYSPKNILIIGHSNTIPMLVRKLGVTDFKPEEIPDNEYDNLYVVTVKSGKASVVKLKYGKPSQ